MMIELRSSSTADESRQTRDNERKTADAVERRSDVFKILGIDMKQLVPNPY